ncbi:MAG TPA: DUF1549 domain-containing protein, partial [Luteolibacter sp.]|nr:DUF1549 domain-containing protein [Luteolibacter sp.]
MKQCYGCHSVEARQSKGNLLLDTREGLLRGGKEGPAVVPFKPEESVLMRALSYKDKELAMPPEKKGGKLPVEVIADFERWIRMGAPDPRSEGLKPVKIYDSEKAKSWWSYQPLSEPEVPVVGSDWPRSDIDRFVWSQMEKAGARPVVDADRATLLRRIFLDLVGLPPDPATLEAFVASPDPLIVEKTIEQLLESRHFGERWGRHWLDVVRYAETTGKDVNITLPEAWRYRDYVIESFAADKPFDQFIREQIAGDLLPVADAKKRAENLIATGFLAVGPKGINEADPRQFAVDLADEQVDTMSRAFLATTLSCARCHDHKFDPISQKDYTAVAGIFISSDTRYGTPGGVRGRNASELIDAPAGSDLPTLDRSMTPAEWQAKSAERDSLLKQQEAALASRRRGEGEGGVSGFEIVRMMTRVKQLEVELSAFHSDGTAKARIMG